MLRICAVVDLISSEYSEVIGDDPGKWGKHLHPPAHPLSQSDIHDLECEVPRTLYYAWDVKDQEVGRWKLHAYKLNVCVRVMCVLIQAARKSKLEQQKNEVRFRFGIV